MKRFIVINQKEENNWGWVLRVEWNWNGDKLVANGAILSAMEEDED